MLQQPNNLIEVCTPEQGKFDNIRAKCALLNNAYEHWMIYSQKKANLRALMHQANLVEIGMQEVQVGREFWEKSHLFLESMAFLSKFCEQIDHRNLQEQIVSSSLEHLMVLPSVKLTCKELQTHFRYKCNSKCGVLSPLEFDHADANFKPLQQPKRIRLKDLRGKISAVLSASHFATASNQLAYATGIQSTATDICMLSVLATLCQKKIQLWFPGGKPQTMQFSPVFIVSSQGARDVLADLLTKAYAPLEHYQENPPYDEVKAVNESKELNKIRRQRKKLDVGSADYEQLTERIKTLENMPEKYNFFITKWSPIKFFKQLEKHPESCCILDTQGDFIRSLLKNTRGVLAMIRFLTISQTPRDFRYENENKERYIIKKRPVTICSIITWEEYDALMSKSSKHFNALVDKLFPIYFEYPPYEIALDSSNNFDEYHKRIFTLIDMIDRSEEIQHYTNFNNYQLSNEMKDFYTSSNKEQHVLYNTINMLMTIYEEMRFTDSIDKQYCQYSFSIGNKILYSKEISHEYATKNPVVNTAKKINKFLLGNQQYYFRLSALQHDLLSNLRKRQIQAAIDWMIDDGYAQAIKSIPTKSRRSVISSRAGQLYMFNLEKAHSEYKISPEFQRIVSAENMRMQDKIFQTTLLSKKSKESHASVTTSGRVPIGHPHPESYRRETCGTLMDQSHNGNINPQAQTQPDEQLTEQSESSMTPPDIETTDVKKEFTSPDSNEDLRQPQDVIQQAPIDLSSQDIPQKPLSKEEKRKEKKRLRKARKKAEREAQKKDSMSIPREALINGLFAL